MTPWPASRPAFFSAVARPHCLSSFSASGMEPPSSRARLHSMMPAPVFSRSCLICAVVAGIGSGVLVLVEVVVIHHEVLFGHHGQLGRHLLDLFLGQSTLGHLADDGGTLLAAFDDR